MTSPSSTQTDDQAHLPLFKATLIAQAAAGLVFGLAPLLVQAGYATALGFSGDDPLVYRLGGAATTGYFVAPVLALAWGAGWARIRIPAIATLTFTIGALGASVWEFLAGTRQPVVPFVVLAGAVFTTVALYWIRRDEAGGIDPGRPVPPLGKAILALATLSAGVFGVLPLLAPGPFATLFGLSGTDGWVFRLAGAGCLGYATAGIASLMAPGYGLMRIQNIAAITFNLLGAISSWIAVVGGNGGLLAPVVAVAASFFTVALIWMDRQLTS
jgi:hypothetical protein